MKFKTTIKITSEAENEKEAMEIVGEYLSGNIVSGVDMNCSTRKVSPYNRAIVGVAVASVVLFVAVFSVMNMRPTQFSLQGPSGLSAIQPPLKTSQTDSKFKKQWRAMKNKELLNYIKK